MRILIIGGYGAFGGRLVQLLAGDARLKLIVAGRSLKRAEEFCRGVASDAALVPTQFDRDGDVAAQMVQLEPDLVVDASGPFQAYGAGRYRVVEAALAQGTDYMDLADGADFVRDIARFDERAQAAGVFILSGVSSCPALTAAVVRRLAQGLARVEHIAGGIAPSPRAGLGLNVIRAIASYTGRSLTIMRDGRKTTGVALAETRYFTIAPPGQVPLEPRLFSLVHVPDLELLPDEWPDLQSIWIGAGPRPALLLRTLGLLAWGVRHRVLPDLAPYAPLFHWVLNKFRWGEHRGGMFVSVRGATNDGRKVERSWHMLAEGDDGPMIPVMGVAALVRHAMEGNRPTAGARPAIRDLELSDYEALFAERAIRTGVRSSGDGESGKPIYRRMLGETYELLPQPIREMHDFAGERVAEGRARVDRGQNILARLVGEIFRFPPASDDVPVRVRFASKDGRETWTRTFGGRSFSSVQFAGTGRSQGLLEERFGPFTFSLALAASPERLDLIVRRWRFFRARASTRAGASGHRL